MESERKRLIAAMQRGMDPNDCNLDDLNDVISGGNDPNSIAESVASQVNEEIEESDAVYDMAAMGAMRRIGDIDFSMCLGNVVLLNTIKSPLIDIEKGDEVSYEDICEALYILFLGKEALRPVMAIQQRVNDMYMLKGMCKNNPEMAKMVVDKVEEISRGRQDFTLKAMDFYEQNFLNQDIQEVFDRLLNMIMDIMKGADEIPPSGVKKKVQCQEAG